MTDPFTNASISAAGGAQSPIERAIANAANRTGVDFDYLLAQAQIESSMDAGAQAPTSSASGLFQFVEQTWLDTLYRHGDAHGLGAFSDGIGMRGGRAFIRDPAMHDTIMELRFDPQASSLMAAALATDNRAALTPVLGREPDASELYLAHFLGQGGATRFLSALQASPDSRADSILPAAASANRPIFYERDGSARTVAEVADFLRAKVEAAMGAEPPSAAQFYTHNAGIPGVMRAQRQPTADSFPAMLAPPRLPSGNIQRSPMSETLLQSFSADADAQVLPSRAAGQIRNAYARLQVFGL